MTIINGFRGKYRFLSNFYPVNIEAKYPSCVNLESVRLMFIVPSVEHAYQASKAVLENDFLRICAARTPGEAKRMGRKIVKRDDFEELKFRIMFDLLLHKFSDQGLRKQLLETGDAKLIEANNWKDTFWGVYKGEGENHLGRLLMNARRFLKETYVR